jgi:hypothetical protein
MVCEGQRTDLQDHIHKLELEFNEFRQEQHNRNNQLLSDIDLINRER